MLLEEENDETVVRNMNWMQTLCSLLNQESLPICTVVGAGHFYGTYGLLNVFSAVPHYKLSRWNLESHTFEGLEVDSLLNIIGREKPNAPQSNYQETEI